VIAETEKIETELNLNKVRIVTTIATTEMNVAFCYSNFQKIIAQQQRYS